MYKSADMLTSSDVIIPSDKGVEDEGYKTIDESIEFFHRSVSASITSAPGYGAANVTFLGEFTPYDNPLLKK